MSKWQQFWEALGRRKTYSDDPDENEIHTNPSNTTLTTLVANSENQSNQTRNGTTITESSGKSDQTPSSSAYNESNRQTSEISSISQSNSNGNLLKFETHSCDQSQNYKQSKLHTNSSHETTNVHSGDNDLNPDELQPSGENPKLARVLGLMDLTMLGVGATLGVGVYVLAGSVARNQAGPSVVVSFAIAAIASLFSGFCYSEFASRISKAGSAYNYTYLSIGEFAAYVIGWNMVLEYIIGTASEAKAISNQIDSLLGNVYETAMTRWLPMRSSFLSTYPDFIAPVFVFLITALLSWGARESAKVNNALTFVNLGTVSVIVIAGCFRLNPANWAIRKADIPPRVRNAGAGGFAPFGVAGIVTGAAKCFFGFVGFDGISTTGEETRNPKRNIPLAIILSLLIVFVCYFSIALVITMVIPYYEQNPDAPFPTIFDRLGWPLMKWAVTIGSLVALFTAMFGAFFPLPRILYAMSRDGLLYQLFCYVSPRTKTPLISTAVSGLITALMSAVFKLDQLVDMMSIGTLLAYIIVAVCVLLLRYSEDEDKTQDPVSVETLGNTYREGTYNNVYETMDTERINNEIGSHSHYQENVSTFSNLHSITAADSFSKTVNDDEDFVSITKREMAKVRAAALQKDAVCSVSKDSLITAPADVHTTFQSNLKPFSKLKWILWNLFNSENVPIVTASSERLSKVCIYILLILTVIISFLLNNVTSDISANDVEDLFESNKSIQLADSLFKINGTAHRTNPSVKDGSHPAFDSSWKSILKPLNDPSLTSNSVHSFDQPSTRRPSQVPKATTMGSFVTDQLGSSQAAAYVKEIVSLDAVTSDKLCFICYVIVGVTYVVTLSILARQGQNTSRLKFKVPFVPLVPCVSIFMNVYLMINLDVSTWVRLTVWLAIGLAVYFSYSISHSKQKKM